MGVVVLAGVLALVYRWRLGWRYGVLLAAVGPRCRVHLKHEQDASRMTDQRKRYTMRDSCFLRPDLRALKRAAVIACVRSQQACDCLSPPRLVHDHIYDWIETKEYMGGDL